MIHVHYNCSNTFTDRLTEHSVDWQPCVPEEVTDRDEVMIPVSINSETGIFNYPEHFKWDEVLDEAPFFCFIDERRGIVCNDYVLNSPHGEYVCLQHVDVETLFEAAKEDNEEANSTAKVAKTATSTSSKEAMRRRRRG